MRPWTHNSSHATLPSRRKQTQILLPQSGSPEDVSPVITLLFGLLRRTLLESARREVAILAQLNVYPNFEAKH